MRDTVGAARQERNSWAGPQDEATVFALAETIRAERTEAAWKRCWLHSHLRTA